MGRCLFLCLQLFAVGWLGVEVPVFPVPPVHVLPVAPLGLQKDSPNVLGLHLLPLGAPKLHGKSKHLKLPIQKNKDINRRNKTLFVVWCFIFLLCNIIFCLGLVRCLNRSRLHLPPLVPRSLPLGVVR